ncbi:MAG: glycosyltransferase family 39 protein [Lachnospiraceae bacterium]|nr:glycosyltransferase family 39 protein [Lachnospiraceae bacterium]
MKLTKTWLSYIIWGFFSIIFFTNIGIAAIEINQRQNTADFLMPMLIMYGGTVFGLLLLYALYKAVEKFVMPKMIKEDEKQSVLEGPLEWFVFALFIFVAIAVRVIAIISSGGQLEGSAIFYDYAIGKGSATSFDVYSNGTYIYTGILSFVLGFLGHMPAPAMAVQAVIQVITIVLTYFMVKKALGRLPAWVAIGLMSFLPGSFMSVRTCSPDGLFTLLLTLFMFVLTFLCEANRSQKITMGAHGVFYILIGIFAALLAYYDIIGLCVVAIVVVAFVQYRNEDAWMKVQRPWFQILLFAISFVLTLFFALWFLPTGGLEVGPASLVSYIMTLVPNGSMNLMILSPHKGQWDSLALFIMAGVWFVGFLRDKRDKAFPYVFLIVCLTISSFLGIGAVKVNDYSVLTSFLWSMLASIGITSIDAFRKNERDVAVAEKAKKDTEERKAKRERRRAEAAGEKSINLEEVHKKPQKDTVSRKDYSSDYGSHTAEPSKKGYGIGRKADTPMTNEVNTFAGAADRSNISDNSYIVKESEVVQKAAVVDTEARTIIKSVDKPPLAVPPAPIPVESKPAYSQGSRSRRALRSPSKSTFTQEDLERISRYTGVSYMASQTIGGQRVEEEPVITEPIRPIQTEPVATAPIEAVVATPVASESVITEPIATPNRVESVQEESAYADNDNVTSVDALQEMNAPAEEKSANYIELDNTVSDNAEPDNSESDSKTEDVSKQEAVTTLPAYKSPSRRHYRHPSKSTFTPEELEKISQYTGMQYKAPDNKGEVTKQVDAPVSNTDAVKVSSDAPQKNVLNNDIKEVKQQPERKPKLIRNPLPGPKPHVAKELSYDYTPKASEMKFDLEDMRGRDYYDI